MFIFLLFFAKTFRGSESDRLSLTQFTLEYFSVIHRAKILFNMYTETVTEKWLSNLESFGHCCWHTHTHTHTHNRLTALCPGLPGWAGARKVKPIWILLKQESEWQWHQLSHMQVCISLQTDNHASTPPLSFLQAECPSCSPTNSVKALNKYRHYFDLTATRQKRQRW